MALNFDLERVQESLQELVAQARAEGHTCVLQKEVKGIEQIDFDLRKKIVKNFVNSNFSIVQTMIATGENLRTIETCLYSDTRLKGLIPSLANELRDICIEGVLNKMHSEVKNSKRGLDMSEFPFKLLALLENKNNTTLTPTFLFQEEEKEKKEGVQIIINTKDLEFSTIDRDKIKGIKKNK